MQRVPRFALAIHGGAGDSWRDTLTPARERAVHRGLEAALAAGHAVLADGGAALDAAVAAVRSLEDCPLFNAGRGASRNRAGDCELDAAVMNGADRGAGAVAGLRRVRNPVLLARAVLERSGHVFLVGEGAEAFATEAGIPLVTNAYFKTAESRRELERALQRQAPPPKGDTVGAVALDAAGNLAAATSTGGVAGKRPGRVGDAPIIGAGTFADNATCAVSTTGYGEYFIRAVVAHQVAALIEHRGQTLEVATHAALQRVVQLGSGGGLVAIDRRGRIAAPFTLAAMPRGWRVAGRQAVTRIW